MGNHGFKKTFGIHDEGLLRTLNIAATMAAYSMAAVPLMILSGGSLTPVLVAGGAGLIHGFTRFGSSNGGKNNNVIGTGENSGLGEGSLTDDDGTSASAEEQDEGQSFGGVGSAEDELGTTDTTAKAGSVIRGNSSFGFTQGTTNTLGA